MPAQTEPSVHRFSFAVQRPADEVFEYIVDPANISQWHASVTAADDAPGLDQISRGKSVGANAKSLCMNMRATAHFAEFEPC